MSGPPCSLPFLLASREMGFSFQRRRGGGTRTRKDPKLFRDHLLRSKDRKFVLSGKKIVSQGDAIYADGKLFQRNNAKKTFDCWAVREAGEPHKFLYSLPARPRWEDQEIWAGSGGILSSSGTLPPLPHDAHKPSLILLRMDNTLTFHDVDTGKVLRSIFLSPKVRFKVLKEPQKYLTTSFFFE